MMIIVPGKLATELMRFRPPSASRPNSTFRVHSRSLESPVHQVMQFRTCIILVHRVDGLECLRGACQLRHVSTMLLEVLERLRGIVERRVRELW
jgi:hypothetical protein